MNLIMGVSIHTGAITSGILSEGGTGMREKSRVRAIVWDMDGTLGSLYDVEDWLPKLREYDPSPYADAAPRVDFEQLYAILEWLKSFGVKIIITSWLSKDSTKEYDKAVRKVKKEWLDKYNFPYDELHFVKYGTTKADCSRKLGGEQVLVDDNEKIRKGWNLGRTIDANKTDDIYKVLAEIVVEMLEEEMQK